MRNIHLKLAALACAAALPGAASAFTIYDDFGAFPDATWGGTGIPNDAVAASRQFIDGDTTITVAMNATGRFSNPPTTNNGAAVYFAQPGSNFGGSGESPTEGALWNWNYYISIDSPARPGAGTDAGRGLAELAVQFPFGLQPAVHHCPGRQFRPECAG